MVSLFKCTPGELYCMTFWKLCLKCRGLYNVNVKFTSSLFYSIVIQHHEWKNLKLPCQSAKVQSAKVPLASLTRKWIINSYCFLFQIWSTS